ncbi:hypothetical protein KEM54_002279, partial [Ascosphaera aggregata]
VARLQESDRVSATATAVTAAGDTSATPAQIPDAAAVAPINASTPIQEPTPTPTSAVAAAQDDVIDWDDDPVPEHVTTTVAVPPAAVSTTSTTTTTTIIATAAPAAAAAAAAAPAAATVPATDLVSAPAGEQQSTTPTVTEAQPVKSSTNAEEPQNQHEPNFALGLAASDLEAELAKRRARAEKFGIVEDSKPQLEEQQKKLERAKRFGGGNDDSAENKDASQTALISGLDKALGEERPRKRGRNAIDGFNKRGKRFRGRGARHGDRGRTATANGNEKPHQQGTNSQTQGISQADAAAMERRKARFG